jgi:hypothetical protein
MEQTHLNVRFAMRQIVISKIQMYQKQHADFVQQLSMEILLPMLAMVRKNNFFFDFKIYSIFFLNFRLYE